ncbi:hypothetical protein ACFX2C_030958 [Malus domestica]
MTYVLSAMFCPKHDQPATMEGDYLATEPLMTHVSVEEAGKRESSRMDMPELARKEPERVYTDMMIFSHPNLALANHLKSIYIIAHLEGVPFKRVLMEELRSMCHQTSR